jgi:hypothetical protein
MPVHDGQWLPGSPAHAEPGGPVIMTIPPYSPAAPAEANAELARRTAELNAIPSAAAALDARAARVRLDGLTRSKEFADRLLSHETSAVHEFNRLSALSASGNDAADALAGFVPPPTAIEVTMDGALPASATRAAVDSLRDAGLSPKAIEEMFAGKKMTRVEHEMARQYQRALLSNPDTVKLFLSGDYETNRSLLLCSAVLSADVEG